MSTAGKAGGRFIAWAVWLLLGMSRAELARATELSCGQEIFASVTLEQDLTCTVSALVIKADGVTIDLGGHTITGTELVPPGSDPRWSGVKTYRGMSLRDVRVVNGTIAGFDRGIDLRGVDGAVLQNLTITGPGSNGIYLAASSGVAVRNVRLTGRSPVPLSFGIQLDRVSGADVRNVEVKDFRGGVHFVCATCSATETPNSGSVKDSSFVNTSTAVSLAATRNLMVAGNHITLAGSRRGNGGGIAVASSPGRVVGVRIVDNTVTNSARGIYVVGATGLHVAGNTVLANLNGGIELSAGSTGNRITSNTALGNGTDLWRDEASAPNTWADNVCQIRSYPDQACGAPLESAWSFRSPMPTRRNAFGIAALDGKIYVAGGWAQASGYDGITNVLEIYDPGTDTWTSGAPMPTARNVLAAAALGGKIYALGGWDGAEVTRKVEIYDPATDTWSAGRPMNTQSSALSAAVLDGKLYAVSGAAVEVYDPGLDTWTTTASYNWRPRWFVATAVLDGKLYALGGAETSDVLAIQTFYDTVQSYDPATDSWTDEAPLRMPRNTHAAAVVGDTIYVVGGMNWRWWETGAYYGAFLSNVEAYQPLGGTSQLRGPLGDGRNCIGAAAVDGKVYAIGGWDVAGASGTVEVYAHPEDLIARSGDWCQVWGGDLAPAYTPYTVALFPQATPDPTLVTCRASGVWNGTGDWILLRSAEHPGYPCQLFDDWLPSVWSWVEYISPAGDATLMCWY